MAGDINKLIVSRVIANHGAAADLGCVERLISNREPTAMRIALNTRRNCRHAIFNRSTILRPECAVIVCRFSIEPQAVAQF